MNGQIGTARGHAASALQLLFGDARDLGRGYRMHYALDGQAGRGARTIVAAAGRHRGCGGARGRELFAFLAECGKRRAKGIAEYVVAFVMVLLWRLLLGMLLMVVVVLLLR